MERDQSQKPQRESTEDAAPGDAAEQSSSKTNLSTNAQPKVTKITGMYAQGNVVVKGDVNAIGQLTINNNNFSREEGAGATAPKRQKPSLPPLPQNPNLFKGRTQFLLDLHGRLRQSENERHDFQKRMTVITGLGGIGKSSCALRYAQEYKNYHENIAWINAETREDALSSFQTIARHLGLNHNDDDGGLVGRVYAKFSTDILNGLFIFDNANQMVTTTTTNDVGANAGLLFGIQEFLPKQQFENYPLFLLTSRNLQWGYQGVDRIQVRPLDPLTLDESIDFLTHSLLGQEDDDKADSLKMKDELNQLVGLLDGYPLALNLAAGSISSSTIIGSGSCSREMKILKLSNAIKKYGQEFKENETHWLQKGPSPYVVSQYDKIMATVWKGTINQIERRGDATGQMALDLMRLISFLPPDRISLELCHLIYDQVDLTQKYPNYDTFTKAEQEILEGAFTGGVSEALDVLIGLSMLTMVQEFGVMLRSLYTKNCVRVHRLVQKWMRVSLKEQPDGGKWLARFANYVSNHVGYFRDHGYLNCLHQHLAEWKWPLATHRPAIDIALYYKGFSKYSPEIRQMYDFLVDDVNNRGSDGYFDLCRLVLVNQNQNEVTHNFETDEWPDFLDNPKWLRALDPFCRIKTTELFWTVATIAQKYPHNVWLQYYAIFVMWPVATMALAPKNILTVDQDKVDQLKKWVHLRQHLLTGHAPLDITHQWAFASVTLFKISSLLFPLPELAKILCDTVNREVKDFAWIGYLHDTIEHLNSLPRSPQEDTTLHDDSIESTPGRFFLHCLLKAGFCNSMVVIKYLMSVGIFAIYRHRPVLRILDIIQLAAQFEENVSLIQTSESLIKGFRFLNEKVMADLCAQKHEVNFEAVYVLTTWIALFTHCRIDQSKSDKTSDVVVVDSNSVWMGMKKFPLNLTGSVAKEHEIRAFRCRRNLDKFLSKFCQNSAAATPPAVSYDVTMLLKEQLDIWQKNGDDKTQDDTVVR